jgi:hypothetical protein
MTKLDPVSFSDPAPPNDLSPPLQVLWWLKKGGLVLGAQWEKAHTICQQDEGNPSYDIVHALAHCIGINALGALARRRLLQSGNGLRASWGE